MSAIAHTPTSAMIEAGAKVAHDLIFGATVARYQAQPGQVDPARIAQAVYIAMANVHPAVAEPTS